MFEIRMGIPEMKKYWDALGEKIASGTATKTETQEYNKIGNVLYHLSIDPKYPGLHTHEISELSVRYGIRVWQSYIENNTPAAKRIFWAYGPSKATITILGIEPHPNDKSNGYSKVTLSQMESQK